MKKTILSLICVSLLALCGCSALDNLILEKQVTPATTNAVSGIVTPEQTQYSVSAPALGGAKLVTSLPIPFAAPAGIVLTFLLQGYASMRNKKALSAVVLGVEAGRKILQETPEGQKLDAQLKDALIHYQEVAGVLNKVSGIVNNITGDTVKS